MTRRLDLRVVVAGGGAIGSVVALTLAQAGARVTLVDPGAVGQGASAVAAGMLAPAFEILLDAAAPPLDLLLQARDRWPMLAASLGVALDRTGAMAVGAPADLDAWQSGMAGLGLPAVRLSPAQARGRSAWLGAGHGGLWTAEDWRLEPAIALAALRRAFEAAGGVVSNQALSTFERGAARLADGRVVEAEALVVATGASLSLVDTAPELRLLTPIKGHILRAVHLVGGGPVLRLGGGYVCPSPGGALIGATMEPGRADDVLDEAAIDGLRRLGVSAVPTLAGLAVTARTGVRAATPDGLPIVGAGRGEGVWLAVGARRNGWLLAPLIAEILAAAMAGETPTAWTRPFDPGRFGGRG